MANIDKGGDPLGRYRPEAIEARRALEDVADEPGWFENAWETVKDYAVPDGLENFLAGKDVSKGETVNDPNDPLANVVDNTNRPSSPELIRRALTQLGNLDGELPPEVEARLVRNLGQPSVDAAKRKLGLIQ